MALKWRTFWHTTSFSKTNPSRSFLCPVRRNETAYHGTFEVEVYKDRSLPVVLHLNLGDAGRMSYTCDREDFANIVSRFPL